MFAESLVGRSAKVPVPRVGRRHRRLLCRRPQLALSKGQSTGVNPGQCLCRDLAYSPRHRSYLRRRPLDPVVGIGSFSIFRKIMLPLPTAGSGGRQQRTITQRPDQHLAKTHTRTHATVVTPAAPALPTPPAVRRLPGIAPPSSSIHVPPAHAIVVRPSKVSRHVNVTCHYRKLWLCLGFQALPRAFYQTLGKENLCRELRSAQQYSRHCILCRGLGRRQDGTLGIIKSLPRASPWQGAHCQRRSERRHIWAAVHCADDSAVRPSAHMLPVQSASSPALGKGVDPGLTRLTGLCRDPAGAIGRVHVCADSPPSTQAPLPRAPPGSRQRSNFF
jgi:hypothetical protein